MTEVKKSDILYMQNELLGDISKLDKRLSDKIAQLTAAIQNQKLITDQKFEMYDEKYKSLLQKIETNEEIKGIKAQFSEFKKDINQIQFVNNSKISSIEKDLKNACYRYDTLFNNNISTPGLIGNGGKYKDLKAFREFVDKKLAELIIYKEKNTIDIKKFKEKTESTIGQFKLRSESSENKYFEFCYEKINEAKKEIMDKFSLLDENLNNLKIENGQYSYDLIKKSEEIQNQIDTLKNLKEEIHTKLNEQAEKYQNYNNDILKLFESQKDEFILIKSRFTELSEFIKDVRFMRNLDNYQKKGNQNNEFDSVPFYKNSRMLSRKINFDKPQKISKKDEIIFSNIKNNIQPEFENNKENNDNQNDDIINIINNDEKQSFQTQEKNKIKYNIKTNINKSKDLNSPKRINNNLLSENLSVNSTAKKSNNLNKTLTLFYKGRNQNNELTESPICKTNVNKKIENNKDDLIKNKSDIYFFKEKNKTQESNKSKNLKLKNIDKNFIKENSYFTTYIKTKDVKDFEFNNDEDDLFNEKTENSENIIQSNNNKIYEFIETQIIEVNKKIKELYDKNKYNIDKINKKIDLYINLNNVLLLKFKNPKNLSNKHINLLTNNEFSIPLLNNTFDKNRIKTEKIRMKSKENSSIYNLKDIKENKELKDLKEGKNIKDIKDIKEINDYYQLRNSGQILSIIEPYLIKKFRSDSFGTNNK